MLFGLMFMLGMSFPSTFLISKVRMSNRFTVTDYIYLRESVKRGGAVCIAVCVFFSGYCEANFIRNQISEGEFWFNGGG